MTRVTLDGSAARQGAVPVAATPPGVASRDRPGVPVIWVLSGLPRTTVVSRLVFFGLVALFTLVSATCLMIATRWVDRPFPGFLVNERMIPGNVGRYEWTGTQAGLRYPDRIVAANGRPVRSMKELDAIIAEAPPRTPITYLVERDGRLVRVTVRTMRFTWADLVMTFGVTFLSGLLYLSLGVIVFLLKPDTRVSWVFLVMSACLGLYSITAFDVQSTHVGFIRLYLLVLALLPAALTHLSLIFPEPLAVLDRRPVVHAAPYLASASLIVPMQALYPAPAFMVPYRIVFAYLMLGAIMTVVTSLAAYLRTASVLTRQRARVVLFAAALAFAFPAVGHYLSLFQGVTIQINFLAIPIAIFPASIAYAIARHNLFDVDVYIKRTVGYGVMTALVGLTYLATQMGARTVLFRNLFGEAGETVYSVLFALMVVFLFNPVNRRITAGVDRLFFRGAFDYKQTISAVSTALTSMLDLDEIISQILRTVRKEMFVDRAGVIVLDRGSARWQAFFTGDRDGPAARADDDTIERSVIDEDDPLLRLVRRERRLVTVYDVREDPAYRAVRDACLDRATAIGATVMMPLVYQNEVTGVLILGRKKSGHFYGREDIDLLSTMADQAAVSLANAMTHQEVVRYAEDLAASLRRIQILESIKSNLAKFVPKTVQDLIEQSPEAPSFEKREADVSVVFADITGYTRLSAQMELEQVNQLVERYFGGFLDEIVKHGGDVNETAGDGLMVIFRDADPARHARAAVRAALGIQRRAREINAELHGQFEPITMHVGVNSGIAFVGATKIEGAAGTRWTYTASGPTTNVAARLAALTEGGAVVVSEGTRQRLGDGFLLEDLGPQRLKNVDDPVRAYRVLGETASATPVRTATERRHHPRRPVSWRVRVRAGEQLVVGRAENASLNGLFVAVTPPHPLLAGASYDVDLITERDRIVRCVGQARHVTDHGVGIETTEMLPPE
jgi:class 3 adenylate cyclase